MHFGIVFFVLGLFLNIVHSIYKHSVHKLHESSSPDQEQQQHDHGGQRDKHHLNESHHPQNMQGGVVRYAEWVPIFPRLSLSLLLSHLMSAWRCLPLHGSSTAYGPSRNLALRARPQPPRRQHERRIVSDGAKLADLAAKSPIPCVHGVVPRANHSIVLGANAGKEHLRVGKLARDLGMGVYADEESAVAMPQVLTLEDESARAGHGAYWGQNWLFKRRLPTLPTMQRTLKPYAPSTQKLPRTRVRMARQ